MGIIPTEVVIAHPPRTGPKITPVSKLRPKPLRDVLLVAGDAMGVFDDIEAFYAFGVPHDTMLINYIASVWTEPFEHYVAGDSHEADMQGVARKLPKGVLKHCWNPTSHGFDVRWVRTSNPGWNGTTANLAVKVGLALDYTRIILAGVPMDSTGNWYKPYIPDNDIKQTKNHENHLWKWSEISCRPQGRFIRSMSGNTKDLFGEPDREWLNKS